MSELLNVNRGLEEHISKLRAVQIEKLDIPRFYIGSWPKNIGVIRVSVRKIGLFFKIRAIPDRSSVFRLSRSFCWGLGGFLLKIYDDGEIEIRTANRRYFSSENISNLEYYSIGMADRGTCLLLFNHLKDSALPKIVRKVERDARYNAEAVEAVKKALEPFLPQLVADKMAE